MRRNVTLAVAVFLSAATLADPADTGLDVTLDVGSQGEYADWARTKLVPAIKAYYPTLTSLLDAPGHVPPQEVTVRLVHEKDEGPAWTDAGGVTLNMAWAKDELKGEAIGAVVHELVHVVQAYRDVRHPGWLTEGIADWVRWMHYEPAAQRERVLRATRGKRYDAGYGETASFLYWCEQRYGLALVRKLNAACRQSAYAPTFWVRETGRPVEALAADWQTPGFSLATYNIRRAGDKGDNAWALRLPRIVDVIRQRGFVLVGFQEAYPEQIADLKRALPGWEAFGRGRSKKHTDEGSPIFWDASMFACAESGEFWLSDHPETPGSNDWKGAFPRICTWVRLREKKSGKEFYYFNTHLDHKSMSARRKSVDLILKRMAALPKGVPVIFSGDLNDEIGTAEYLAEVKKKDATVLTPDGPDHPINVLKTRLADAREKSRTKPKGTVWSDNGYGKKHVKRIDYIFVSDGIGVESYETCCDRPDGKYPSDHEAVTARLILK